MDYKRKIQSSGSQDSGNLTIEFATVTLNGKDIGEMLVSNGFATVIRHRNGEERARNYEHYIELEKDAVSGRKGVHDMKGIVSSFRRINDLSSKEATRRAKESFPHFQRTGPFHGIVEYILSGSRYKILLPKESTMIAFALEYVRCPPSSKATAMRNDIGDAALHFARDNILQRDVEVRFSTVDRVGTFIGKMRVLERSSSDDLEWERTLLEQGLGYLNEMIRDKAPSILKEKEKIAKENQKGLWSVISEQNGSETKRADTYIQFYGKVSEVGGGGRLFIQSEEADTQNILHAVEQQLSELGIHGGGREIPFSALKVGDKVAAKYSVDNRWYRGVIREKDALEEKLLVQFVDYGNEEWIAYDEIRGLPISSQNIPTAAYCVSLKDVVVPELTQEYGIEAGEALRDLVWNTRVLVQGTKRMDFATNIPQVIADVFVESEQEKRNVAVELLRKGLARILRRKDATSRAAYERYGQEEEVARRAHRFLWRFGDAYASDEDMET
ncbi:Staphylococcal nuclease domain-containing protein 1 [Galdieria sulphuraria]|nr:Staphylococcal nuclease domain-containing protein 1 [Galdieria sulphuraria]